MEILGPQSKHEGSFKREEGNYDLLLHTFKESKFRVTNQLIPGQRNPRKGGQFLAVIYSNIPKCLPSIGEHHPKIFSVTSDSHKTLANLSASAYSGSSLTGRSDILVIPKNHLK